MSTLTWITKAYTHTVSLRHALFILKVTINFHIKNTEFLDQNHTPPATDYSVHWILECILITSPWSFKLTLQKFDILLVRSTNKVIYNLIQNNNALTEATISQLNVTSSISSVNYLLLFDYWVYHKRIQICHRWQTCKHSQGYHFNTTNSSLSSVLISEKHKQGGTPLRPLKKACSEKRLLLPAVTNDNSYHSLLNAVINTIHSKSTFKKHVNISLPYWSWDTREHWFWLKLPCNWSSREKYSAWNVYSKLLRNQTIRFALSSNKLDSVQCCRHCQWQ